MNGLLLLHLVLLARPAAGGPAQPSTAELAREVQQRYDRVKDFTADFTHMYEGGVLKKKTTEHGVVEIKKPGRMRWEYRSPEKKLFVSDGTKIYSYIPADKQVVISPMPADSDTTAVLFLSGKGDLTRDFDVSFTSGAAADEWALRLDPKQRQRDYDWLVLIVNRQTLQIHTLVAGDQDGGRSTFTFDHYRENVGLADTVFAFKIPRGTDVITTGSGR
jgi:outer membrane lipoprotein carrier protein